MMECSADRESRAVAGTFFHPRVDPIHPGFKCFMQVCKDYFPATPINSAILITGSSLTRLPS